MNNESLKIAHQLITQLQIEIATEESKQIAEKKQIKLNQIIKIVNEG